MLDTAMAPRDVVSAAARRAHGAVPQRAPAGCDLATSLRSLETVPLLTTLQLNQMTREDVPHIKPG